MERHRLGGGRSHLTMIGAGGDTVPLAIITLVGTIATAIIALIGTVLTKRSDAKQATAEELASVKAALSEHVEWEMREKYEHPPTLPWDGSERREP